MDVNGSGMRGRISSGANKNKTTTRTLHQAAPTRMPTSKDDQRASVERRRTETPLESRIKEKYFNDLRNVSFSVYSHDFICLTDETIDHKYTYVPIRFYLCMS